ncbi:flavodoxin domain-containing protein [Candidatus Peregrinibacteria bacterium]|nr:flavodoxin domain-containing protein [Candidatus Peregrinibacteria bacterium]
MKSVLIIFGSTGGNTEIVVDFVGNILTQKTHAVQIERVEKSVISDLEKYDVTILAAPTYGHGVMQPDFVPFLQTLKNTNLAGKKFAIIGLGDPKYEKEYHLESAKMLEETVKKQGGILVVQSLRITKSPVPLLDGKITDWTNGFSEATQK